MVNIFNLCQNGLLSSIPYIACAFSNAVLAVLGQRVVHANLLTRTNLRKVSTGIGIFIKSYQTINYQPLKKIFVPLRAYWSNGFIDMSFFY
jgi:hypothetical protein